MKNKKIFYIPITCFCANARNCNINVGILNINMLYVLFEIKGPNMLSYYFVSR